MICRGVPIEQHLVQVLRELKVQELLVHREASTSSYESFQFSVVQLALSVLPQISSYLHFVSEAALADFYGIRLRNFIIIIMKRRFGSFSPLLSTVRWADPSSVSSSVKWTLLLLM